MEEKRSRTRLCEVFTTSRRCLCGNKHADVVGRNWNSKSEYSKSHRNKFLIGEAVFYYFFTFKFNICMIIKIYYT